MNLLGRRSLSSVLKTLLDVGFYLSWVVGVILLVVFALLLFTGGGNRTIQLPVTFDLSPSAYQLESWVGPDVTA